MRVASSQRELSTNVSVSWLTDRSHTHVRCQHSRHLTSHVVFVAALYATLVVSRVSRMAAGEG